MYFKIYNTCILVEGSLFSTLIDVQNSRYIHINKEIGLYLKNINNKLFSFSHQDESELMKNEEFLFMDQFVKNGFAFFSKSINKFREINIDIQLNNFLISNIILDVSDKYNYLKEERLIKSINDLGVKKICLRLLGCETHSIKKFINDLNKSFVEDIEIVADFSQKEILIEEVLAINLRINTLSLYNSPVKKVEKNSLYTIYYTKINFNTSKLCGIVSENYFVCNFLFYIDAKKQNTCLSHKISIDTEGNIKNCPSMSKSFGNIRDTTLEEALAHPDFKKYWNVKKDDITKCKDCEFRYICTDCRAYIDDPEDMYSAPLKCGYDPYTGVWEEWSTNPLKQKAIAYYGMEDLIAGDKENNV